MLKIKVREYGSARLLKEAASRGDLRVDRLARVRILEGDPYPPALERVARVCLILCTRFKAEMLGGGQGGGVGAVGGWR